MSGKRGKHERRERQRVKARLAEAAAEPPAPATPTADVTVPASHLAELQPADAPGSAIIEPPTAPTRREDAGTRRTKSRPPQAAPTRPSRAPAVRKKTEPPAPRPAAPPPPAPAPVTRTVPPPAKPEASSGTLASFVSATRRLLKKFTGAPPEVRIALPKTGDIRLFTLSGEIDERMALQAATWLLFVQAMKADADVVVTVDSPGGSVTAGLSLIDVMLKATCRVRTHCARQALGIASIVLAAGSHGYRTLSKASILSLPGGMGSGSGGQTTRLSSPRVIEAVAAAVRRPAKDVERDLAKPATFGAKQAVKLGIADAVAV